MSHEMCDLMAWNQRQGANEEDEDLEQEPELEKLQERHITSYVQKPKIHRSGGIKLLPLIPYALPMASLLI